MYNFKDEYSLNEIINLSEQSRSKVYKILKEEQENLSKNKRRIREDKNKRGKPTKFFNKQATIYLLSKIWDTNKYAVEDYLIVKSEEESRFRNLDTYIDNLVTFKTKNDPEYKEFQKELIALKAEIINLEDRNKFLDEECTHEQHVINQQDNYIKSLEATVEDFKQIKENTQKILEILKNENTDPI
jgi:hypothetical protein